MILFLNRNDEKWSHTRQIKIAGRNHILPPLGIAWKQLVNLRLSETIRTFIIALNMVQLTTEQRTFVIKTFYETSTLQQTRVAFGLINFA
jgi:hypothetical protein